MSIATALQNLSNDITSARSSIVSKGGTVTVDGGSSHLATDIGTITELKGSTETITPTTSSQTVTPTSPSNGFTSVTVSAVTYTIDPNIVSSNIKSGTSILGVAGSVVELNGETRSETLTNSAGQTYTPSSGKNGITSITVTPNNQAKTITPTTSSQTITVQSGYSGYGTLTVNPVTSSIDANIQAGNIKSGVSILGVNGSVVELNGQTRTESLVNMAGQTYTPNAGKNAITSITVVPKLYAPPAANPTTSSQTITTPVGYCGMSLFNVNAVTSSIDANIQAGNIKNGVTILGITGNYTGSPPTGTLPITLNGTYDVSNYANVDVNVSGGASLKYGADIDDTLPNLNSVGSFLSMPANNHEVVFTGLKMLNGFEMASKFNKSGVKKLSFPNLTTIGESTFLATIANSRVEEVSFGALATIGSSYCFNQFAIYANSLKKVSFPALTTISNSYVFSSFLSSSGVEKVEFPELTTISGSYVFEYAFSGASKIGMVTFPKITQLTNSYVFQRAFNAISSPVNTPILYMPNLTQISGSYTFYYLFNNNNGWVDNKIRLPKLKTIGTSSTQGTFCYAFYGGNNADSTQSFPELETITQSSNSSSASTFYAWQRVKRINLPKLNTVSGNGQNYLFHSCSRLTEIHFGIANQTAIQAMSGYATLWGRGAGRATVYFDLVNTITVGGVNYVRDGGHYDYDNDYYGFTDTSNNTIYTSGEYTQTVGGTVYTKSGDTYTALPDTITAIA